MILHPNSANRPSSLFSKLAGAAVFAVAMAGGQTPNAVAQAEPDPVAKELAEPTKEKSAGASLAKKLQTMILPSVEFSDTPLFAAVEFLQHRSVELDPDKKGINIIVSPDLDKDALITLKLTEVPFGEALRYTATLAQGGLRIDEDAVALLPAKDVKPTAADSASAPGVKAIRAKLDAIQFASIEFSGTPFTDALGFLRSKSADLDKTEKDAAKKGITIVLNSGEGVNVGDIKVSLKLSDISLATALRYTCEQAGFEYAVEAGAVVITPASKKAE